MSEIQKTVGLRIRELRNRTGLSQEKFALKIEMDRTYLASVESGRRNISIISNPLKKAISIKQIQTKMASE